MTTYSKKTTLLPPVLKLAILACLAVSFYGLVTPSVLAEVASDAHLNRVVAITLGNRQISLPAGTIVHLLQEKNGMATVSLQLQDGSPVITQVSSDSLQESSPQQASLSATNSSSLPTQSQPTQDTISPVSSDVAIPAPENSVPPDTALDDDSPKHPIFGNPLNPIDTSLPQKKYTSLNGFFYILIDGNAVPVVYSLPMEGKKLAKSASNLVFYGPHPTELAKLDKGIIPDLVSNLGCSVFSFSFTASSDDLADPKTAYWTKESGWFKAVLDARDEVIKGFGLERRPLILMGYSGGGGMVLNFAGAFPNEVEAVATQGANLAPDISEKNAIKWLIVNNRGEPNAGVTKPFYDRLRSLGCNALYCETTPERKRGNYHGATKEAEGLMYSFIAGILNQRNYEANGIKDAQHIWPYAASIDPLKRYAVVKTSDLSEQDISSNLFDLLPSATFALNWSKVCPPLQRITLPNESSGLHVSFPAQEKPKGIILYYDNCDYQNVAKVVEDVSTLAEHGCVVISPSGTPNPADFLKSATAWVLSQASLKEIRVHLVGYGSRGANFISDMANNSSLSPQSISLIDFDSSDLDDSTKANIEAVAKGCGVYGFYLYSDSMQNTSLNKLADDLVTKGSQERGCCKWLVSSQAIEKEKGEEEAIEMVKHIIDKSDNAGTQVPECITLVELEAPQIAKVNEDIEINVHIRTADMGAQDSAVQLKANGIVVDEEPILLFANIDQKVAMNYTPLDAGKVELEATVLSFPEVAVKANKATKANITIIDRKSNALNSPN
jgi:hypothetical protein